MKILYEKYEGRERLDAWTNIFNNIDEVIAFMSEHKDHALGDGFTIKISSVKYKG